MPSVGRIHKLWVLGIATAAVGANASTASAGDVWLWACQGPAGQPLGGSPFEGSGFADGCDEAGGVLRGELTAQDQAERRLRATVPPGTKLAKVTLQHTVGSGALYTVTAPTNEQPLGPLVNGEQTLPVSATAGGGELKLSLKCASSACENASLAVGKIGLNVVDDSKPTLAVGGVRSPGSDYNSSTARYDLPMMFDVRASDSGSGLRRADILIDGAVVAGAAFVGDACPAEDLSPGSPQVDLALGAQCVMYDGVQIPVATTAFGDGPHTLEVRVTDWAGNVGSWTPSAPWSILNNPDLGSPTATLNIGSSGIVEPPQQNPSPGPGGGVGGAQSSSCRTPRLSVSLDSKPLRISKRRPVLLAKKRYRFEGRLTCVVNGKRRSAPKSTRIEVLNKVGRKTVSKPATRLRSGGKINVLLKTPNVSGSRTLIFRYRNASGQRSQVSIRVTITKRAPRR